MNVIQSNHPQGSPEWKAGRQGKFNASEAATMLGVPGSYGTRQDLLAQFVTGIEKDISPALQSIFDRGHLFEELARPLAEKIIEAEVPLADLYPVVLQVADEDELPLSASLDGRTMCKSITFEHKTLNQKLAAALADGIIPIEYKPQMEQGFILSPTTKKCLFMATKWEESDEIEEGKVYGTVLDEDGNERRYVLIEEKHAWYYPNPELQARIMDGWKQFAADAMNYQHVETDKPAPGRAPETLPALHVEVTGMVTASNLAQFKETAMAVFKGINTDLQTDVDFANAEKTVKWCKEVEDRLEQTKQHALGQTTSIDELFRTMDSIKEEARTVRLTLDKLVKSEKESRKAEIIVNARKAIEEHIQKLNVRIGGNWMTTASAAAFAEAIKGLKSLDSMREKVGNALRDMMFDASQMADRIEANRKRLTGQGNDLMFLFPDFPPSARSQSMTSLHCCRCESPTTKPPKKNASKPSARRFALRNAPRQSVKRRPKRKQRKTASARKNNPRPGSRLNLVQKTSKLNAMQKRQSQKLRK
jgi:predicted phage-related endonuclease